MLATAPISSPGWDNWTEFMAHEPGRPIRGVDAYRDHLVVGCRKDGLPQVMILRLSDGNSHYIAGIEEDDFAISPRSGREFDTASLRFGYTSLKTPAAVYDYDMGTQERILRKQQRYRQATTATNTRPGASGPRPGTARRFPSPADAPGYSN